MLCSDTCFWADDGWCDDGGPGSDNGDCSYGSDCIDCGIRAPGVTLCDDTCGWAYDDYCDDGGPYSDTSLCSLGSDCTDCGPRML